MSEDPRQRRRIAADDFLRSLGQLESVLGESAPESGQEQPDQTGPDTPANAPCWPPGPGERGPGPDPGNPPADGAGPASFAEVMAAAAADIEAFMQSREGTP